MIKMSLQGFNSQQIDYLIHVLTTRHGFLTATPGAKLNKKEQSSVVILESQVATLSADVARLTARLDTLARTGKVQEPKKEPVKPEKKSDSSDSGDRKKNKPRRKQKESPESVEDPTSEIPDNIQKLMDKARASKKA